MGAGARTGRGAVEEEGGGRRKARSAGGGGAGEAALAIAEYFRLRLSAHSAGATGIGGGPPMDVISKKWGHRQVDLGISGCRIIRLNPCAALSTVWYNKRLRGKKPHMKPGARAAKRKGKDDWERQTTMKTARILMRIWNPVGLR